MTIKLPPITPFYGVISILRIPIVVKPRMPMLIFLTILLLILELISIFLYIYSIKKIKFLLFFGKYLKNC